MEMPNIYIVTDSTSDMPQSVQEQYGIHVVPLKVHFGEKTYLDGVDLTPDQFYELLAKSDTLPTTSQPSPAEFLETYKRILEKDPDAHIISVHISAAFSGTYQSAQLAKNLLGDDAPVTVLDSKTTSYALGWMAVAMAKAAARGESVEACIQKAEAIRRSTGLYFLVDTLEYLQRGGRIGKAAALAGSLLNIKPILSIDEEGEVTSVDKVRGRKRAIERIIELLKKQFPSDQEVVAFFPQASAETGAATLRDRVVENFRVRESDYTFIGPVLGTHVGPGTFAVIMVPADHG